jgi:hypothetical protein
MEPIARSQEKSNALSGNILGMLFTKFPPEPLIIETAMKRLVESTVVSLKRDQFSY